MSLTKFQKLLNFLMLCYKNRSKNREHIFSSMVLYDDDLIDFMSPIFSETAESSQYGFLPAAKSFQRRNPSAVDLIQAVDFFFDPNQGLTDSLHRKGMESQFFNDVIAGYCDWYRRPPKGILPTFPVGDGKGLVTTMKLKDASVVGAW